MNRCTFGVLRAQWGFSATSFAVCGSSHSRCQTLQGLDCGTFFKAQDRQPAQSQLVHPLQEQRSLAHWPAAQLGSTSMPGTRRPAASCMLLVIFQSPSGCSSKVLGIHPANCSSYPQAHPWRDLCRVDELVCAEDIGPSVPSAGSGVIRQYTKADAKSLVDLGATRPS